ncbi:hypothetical protein MMC26_001251 [Xylographa opegraphella]|nr:hypothetical protein [Xylographa opegraphella]
MTSSNAYAIFPRPTFLQYKTYTLNIFDEACWSTLAKYTQHGWRTQDVLWEEEESPYHPIRKLRRIGDHSTWKISFDTTNVEESSIPDEVFETAEFEMFLSYDDCQSTYVIETDIFSAFTLRYHHFFAESDVDFWTKLVEDRMGRLTYIERMKLDKDGRAAFDLVKHLTSIRYERLKVFDAPETWTYWDDELPNWYKAWKDNQPKEDLAHWKID